MMKFFDASIQEISKEENDEQSPKSPSLLLDKKPIKKSRTDKSTRTGK
jgi:hypothetical protein